LLKSSYNLQTRSEEVITYMVNTYIHTYIFFSRSWCDLPSGCLDYDFKADQQAGM
jgi:hypothetical protein